MAEIALAMIVRDNAHVVSRCLRSARPHIQSWTVVDTGSVDDTPDVVSRELSGIPGKLHRRPWVGSGHNRTELLRLARGTADYLLLLDGDMELQAGGDLRELTAPVYMLRQREQNLEWRMPLLVAADREWSYVGSAHEYLDTGPAREPLDKWVVIHHGDGRPQRERLDVALDELERAHADDPADARTLFYLAQTHRDLGNVEKAIGYYRLRVAVGGWDEETFYAQYRLGCLLTEHVSFHEGAAVLLEAFRMRPGRVEPLRAIASAATAIADRAPLSSDLLFVHRDAYKAAG